MMLREQVGLFTAFLAIGVEYTFACDELNADREITLDLHEGLNVSTRLPKHHTSFYKRAELEVTGARK